MEYVGNLAHVRTKALHSGFPELLRRGLASLPGFFLPLCAFALWLFSLRAVDLSHMNDLGLVSVFTPLTLLSLVLLSLSFCFALRSTNAPALLFHVILLIVMLYGVTALLEAEPRFSVVYRHAGFTEYIMRHSNVNPNLDAYFNWPGFFIMSAFVTRIAGYRDILAYAAWAPVVYNLLYLSPLYMLFSAASQRKPVIWLALWCFYLTNWIGQDYFSPQGLNFFLYLMIIAILLTWFRTPTVHYSEKPTHPSGLLRSFLAKISTWLRAPDSAPAPQLSMWQRRALLGFLLLIFAFAVCSHPLTPFFALMSVWALILFRRCGPFWLPVVMTLLNVAWIALMTQAYLSGHFAVAFGQIGLSNSVSSNLTQHLVGNAQHTFIAQLRVVMTLLVWLLALLGGLRRLIAGARDVTYMLLALAPFPLLVAQPYGGEMLLRIYLFTLPVMCFFMASLFITPLQQRETSWLKIVGVLGMCLLLLGGFLFTRYGNERMDYMTTAEVTGVRHLYDLAPPHSMLLAGWAGTPWQFKDYEEYDTYTLADDLPEAMVHTDASMVVSFIESNKTHRSNGQVYLVFTRTQRVTIDATTNLPPGALDRLENALLKTGKFTLLYHNPDAHILLYKPATKGI